MANRDELGEALAKVEQEISAWCMRMAWPGGMPTPPFQAWEKRSQIYADLRGIGVENPKYEHQRWRDRMAKK